MDIEKLTKAQIVLLTLLVSFVTSIATGIVTVTLLDQAPPALTQTINRVVERTVERVVPGETQPASVVTREVRETVVVNESDLITEAITAVSGSLADVIRIVEGEDVVVGIGIVLAQDGIVATDSAIITEGGTYDLQYSNGSRVRARVVDNAADAAAALLLPLPEEGTSFKAGPPVAFADQKELKLGQSVIALSGGSSGRVAIGNITEFSSSLDIQTTIDTETVRKGGPLITIYGDVIGLNTFQGRPTKAFTSVQGLKTQLAGFRNSEKATAQ